MPPKKVEEPERKPLIGRVGTNLKVGIVGIPNVGKSTFFNVLTKSQAAAENFPFCTIDPNENKIVQVHAMCDKILREEEKTRDKTSQRLEGYCSDYETLNKHEILREFGGYVSDESSEHWPPTLSTWCPRANIYYAYTEDTNPFDRVEEFIANERNNPDERINRFNFDPPLEPFTIRDPYEENAARAKYLRSEPVSFVIFAKPGMDTEKLANIIAEWWNCILISPKSLVREEIDKNSDKGLWIADALQRGETLESSVIMNLIESRVKERDVMHRGYVVEGLPLIPENPEIEYPTCPETISPEGDTAKCCANGGACAIEPVATSSSSRSSTSLRSNEQSFGPASLSAMPLQRGNFDVNARMNLLRRTTIQETLREVKDMAFLHARINPFRDEDSGKSMSEKYEDYAPQQIDMIFETWPVKPTIIVYVTCPDEDVTERREYFRNDPLVGKSYPGFHETMENQFDDERLEKDLLMNVSDTADITLQCEIYKRYALPVIERQVLRHNPQNVIRVEGRTTVSRMFETVSARLRSLPLSRAMIPKRLSDYTLQGEDDEDFEAGNNGKSNGTIKDQVFEELSRKFTISSKFHWTLSNWKFTCPVELAKGRRIEGKAEHAVRFMNKIFFPSSAESMKLFLDNPRPFIASMKPRPCCRIVIFGPKYSGKSELSEALGREFRGIVIDVRELIKEMIDERIDANVASAVRKARNRVIKDLRAKLINERALRETARKEALNVWYDEAREIIRQLDQFQRNNVANDEEDSSKASDFMILREKLREYDLETFEINHDLLEATRNNETMIYDYAPVVLRNEEPPIRDLSEHDPEVAAILENEVKHLRDDNIVIKNADIAGLLVSRIKMIPDEPIDDELSREPGCIVDGMDPDPEIWRILAEAGVIFNELILITDKPPYDNLLLSWKRYYAARNELGEDIDFEYIDESTGTREMENYIADIKDFEQKWENFSTMLEKLGIEPLICHFDETTNLYETVARLITDPYRLEAKILTDQEREDEFEGSIESMTDADEEYGVEEAEDLEESKSKKSASANRRFGDTGIYCPVALARNRVLWKGKDEHGASFLDKLYLCSSQEALEDFVKNPEAFNVPFIEPMRPIPFARICIVGPPGSGKSTLAKSLSMEYGMIHADFPNLLDRYTRDRGIIPPDGNEQDRLEEISLPSDLTDERYGDDGQTILAFLENYEKHGASLPRPILDECFFKFFKAPHDASAIIFDSFPNCPEDAEIMMSNYAVPELVIELQCSLEKVQERLLPELLGSLVKTQRNRKNSEDEEDEEEATADEEEARERILRDIEESHERKSQMLDKTRTRIEEESINWMVVNADGDIDDLLANLRKIIRPLVRRDISPFEKTYRIDPYRADDLLECGYYLLSSFGRSCPVQMYDGLNPIQMYLPMDEKDQICPILHRHYIYFVASDEASRMFEKDPLKYIQQDSCDPVVPARISIVGPPKSGKTTLARRFAKAYGMSVINRENALRWTRERCGWTKAAIEIEESSRSGVTITKKLFARAVELSCSDHSSSTQGYVLDGIPADREETEELALLNIRPLIYIKLQADRDFYRESTLENGETFHEENSRQSLNSMAQRCEDWREVSSSFLDWLEKFTQNIVGIDATASKWAVWRQSDRQLRIKLADIKRYYREADYAKCHSLRNLSVTPYEFKNRQSPCESYCPACLHHDETMTFSGSPPDRRGLVQYREYFYWLCPKHFPDFMKNPLACLPPRSKATLPVIRPQILNDEIDTEHACWAKRLVANGNCIVTYADALPQCAIVPGKRNIGILYEDRLYLFCTLDCREKFASRAAMYGRIVPGMTEATATTISVRNLTNLDYLEKTVAEFIVRTVNEVAQKRPKYPGLTPAISAAIYIGICLKINNVACPLDEIKAYEEVHRRLEARSRKVPAFLNVVDIAGLVKGAAEGQGLGNAFLSHISACDAIFHLCRAFEDDDVTHIEGEVNPVRDLEIISEELRLKDIEFLAIHLEKLEKLVVRGNDKKLKPEYDTLLKVKHILHEEKNHIRFADWSVNEIEILNKYLFLTSKPVIYLVNLSEKDYIRKKNKWLIKIKEWVDKNDPGAILIPFSGAFENNVVDMSEAEKAKYFEESKVTSALDKIIVQGYKALQLQYFFTSGADEVKAWTIQKGTKAPQAAGRIHTDFEKGFIMAEVMKFDDFKSEGSENGVKAAGKYRQQGRNYVVEDGDIIFFKFNAGAGLKDAKKK